MMLNLKCSLPLNMFLCLTNHFSADDLLGLDGDHLLNWEQELREEIVRTLEQGWWYFTLKEQVFLGPASALLWGNTIFRILTFRNIVHDVKVVDRCLATTPPVSWQQVDKCDWSAPQPIKKHVCVGHNDAWGQLKDTLPPPSMSLHSSTCNLSEGLKCPLSLDTL